MTTNNRVYPVRINKHELNADVEGHHVPYFYLHGMLEQVVGYDICNINTNLMIKLFKQGITIAKCKLNDLEFNVIIFSWFEEGRMKGNVCLINDINSFEYALKKSGTTVYEHEKKQIKEHYPEVWKYILKINKDNDNVNFKQ